MKAFIKTSENLFGGPGIQLKQRVHTELDYYNDIENSVDVKGGFCEKKNGFVSGIDKFMKNFLSFSFFWSGLQCPKAYSLWGGVVPSPSIG